MKPEHRLMLRKVGKGSMFREPMQDRMWRDPYDKPKPKPVVDPRPYMPTIENARQPVNIFRGEGVKPKRKPLKFKL